ncbi:MAG: lauroyl acyltransferase [Gammaproteobacteria bacterium]|nr:lauroyl acyltransferase [Gammaproteobacteria bacterium]
MDDGHAASRLSSLVMAAASAVPRSSWWVRALASLPMSALHALSVLLAWLAMRVFHYEAQRIRDSLCIAFPQLDPAGIEQLRAAHYRSFADVLVEIIKAASIPGNDLDARMHFPNLDVLRAPVKAGTPVLIVAAHQCNWEWILLGLSRQLGVPLDAAYKPLVNSWADREMLALRSRFGARLVASGVLMRDMIARRRVPRVVALVADQEPVSSERRHWTRFLNRDTAFFMGPDVLVNSFGYPAFFVAIRRTSRGAYEVRFEPLWQRGEALQPGEFTGRYARRVEQQIRESPADWPWSYKRWRLRPERTPSCPGDDDSAESAAP